MAKMTTIGCKMPMGLILSLNGVSHTLNGQNKSRMVNARGIPFPEAVGITEIPKDFWDEWRKVYAKYAPLEKGLIFEQSSEKAVEKAAEKLTEVPNNAPVKQTKKLKED